MLKLQASLNKALQFVYNVNWPTNIISARTLHARARIMPINQTIHHSANKLWQKIKAGTAADSTVFNKILNIPYIKPNKRFHFSYLRSIKDEPPPLFTVNDSHSRDVLSYYNS